jgi:hypothetical protein
MYRYVCYRYVSYSEYAAEYFGKYCSGSAYIFTVDLVPRLYNSSKNERFFWIDDYYITGLLARAVNAQYYQAQSLYSIFESHIEYFRIKNYLFGHFPHKFNDIYVIWNYLNIYSSDLSTKAEFKWNQKIYNQSQTI